MKCEVCDAPAAGLSKRKGAWVCIVCRNMYDGMSDESRLLRDLKVIVQDSISAAIAGIEMGLKMAKGEEIGKKKLEYTDEIPEYGDVMEVPKFMNCCESGGFIDYDGHGHPAKDGKMMSMEIKPSTRNSIPEDATHIVWFNK